MGVVILPLALFVTLIIRVLPGVIYRAGTEPDGFLLVLGLLLPSLIYMAVLFAYCFIEPLFFALFGTTPGKALLGIDVRTQSGEWLSYGQAMKRSLRVWFYGLGAGTIVAFGTLWHAYANLTQGITTWDRLGNFRVSHRPIGVLRGTIATVLIVVLYVIYAGLRGS